MTDTQKIFRGHVQGEASPPSEVAEYFANGDGEVLEGNPNDRFNVIRKGTSAGRPLLAGVISLDPCVVVETTEYDEVIQIVEGELELDNGEEVLSLSPGDVISISKGLKATWRIKTPVKELFVAVDPG